MDSKFNDKCPYKRQKRRLRQRTRPLEDRGRDWEMQLQFEECQGVLGDTRDKKGFFPRAFRGRVTL